MIKLHKTLKSFGYAFAGLRVFFLHENNARVHLLAALAAILVGFWLQISSIEWALVLLSIGSVWAAEAFNTALEKLCDLVEPDIHPRIKIIKDLAAAAVFFTAVMAACIGIIIFLPKIW